MLQTLERMLHLPPKVFYRLALFALLLVAFVLGFLLDRVFKRYAKKFENTWKEVLFALLQPLPIPLLMLAAFYTALEVLTLPRFYERLGAKLISCVVILVIFYFPARGVVVFVRRVGHRRRELEPVMHFVAVITRALFVLLALYTALEVLELPRSYERFGSKLTAALGTGLVFYALAQPEGAGSPARHPTGSLCHALGVRAVRRHHHPGEPWRPPHGGVDDFGSGQRGRGSGVAGNAQQSVCGAVPAG